MKILFTYSSKTGNTKMLCDAVYENIKDKAEIDYMPVKEAPNDLAPYDLVVVGFWIDKGTANKKARKFIDTIENKKVAFLATLGAAPDSEHGKKCFNRMPEILNKSNEYLGVVLARGKVNEKLTKRIKLLPLPKNIKDQMYEASVNSRPPNEEEMKKASEFILGLL